MRKKKQSGAALVEVAVLAPLMSLLLMGTIWFGYAFYTFNQLEKSIHDAGRYASTRKLQDSADGKTQYVNQVKNIAVYGNSNLTGLTYPVVPNLTASNITVALECNTGQTTGRPLAVRISVTNYPIPGLFGSVTLNKPVVRFPYLGSLASPPPPSGGGGGSVTGACGS